MRTLAPGLHVLEAPQRFLGLEVGARMTVMETDRGVLVHSPVAVDPGSLPMGPAKWVVAPNKLHHLYVRPWMEAGVAAWLAPGLLAKRPDLIGAGTLASDTEPFGADVGVYALSCFAMSNEVVLLHRPTRTLVVTDLVFHFTPQAPWLTRAAMTCLCGYPGCSTTVLERVGFRRDVARREVGELLRLDFDRLVMAHGEVIETGGREALAGAMGWLGV